MNDPVTIQQIHGSCHCGNIRVTLDWPGATATIPARACGCGLCTKHRAVWTSHPDGCFHLEIADEKLVNLYRFGTETADFFICRRCGVVPIATCMIDEREYAVINVNAFDDLARSQLVETPTDFEGETTDNRLARREQNWTPRAPGGV